MKFSKDYNSKVDYKKLLSNNKVLLAISEITDSRFTQVKKLARILRKKLPIWIQCNGLKATALRIKESERSFLLTGKTTWFSSKYFCASGITPRCSSILMSIHRNMYTRPVLDTEAIEHKHMGIDKFQNDYKSEIRKVLRNKVFWFPRFLLGDYKVKLGGTNPEFKLFGNLSNDPTVDSNNRTGGLTHPLRISLSGGANGLAINSQEKDYTALQSFPTLLAAIRTLWHYWGYELQETNNPTVSNGLPCEHIVSKLHALQDRSCKTRVIAIFDSYSQIALRPIHHTLDKVLQRNPHDFTHDQMAGVRYLMGHNCDYVSIDLKSATDNIPVELSLLILSHVLGNSKKNDLHPDDYSSIIEATRIVLTKRPFRGPDGKDYYYGTGQPMGAYASFPLLAITNHFLCLLAMELCGKSDIPYAVVGDDIVIGNKDVSKQYCKLVESLSIPINYSKNIEGRNTFEFCRRIVVDGRMKSVPSWNAFYSSINRRDPTILCNLLTQYDMPLPIYSNLTRFFSIRTLRTMVALQPHIKLRDAPPSVVIIPNEVKSHAERVLDVERLLSLQQTQVETENPFLQRLNYQFKIETLFKSKIKSAKKKGKSLWETVFEVKANTFYLGYVLTYKSRSLLRKKSFSYYNKDAITRSIKIRELCMKYRHKWSLIPS